MNILSFCQVGFIPHFVRKLIASCTVYTERREDLAVELSILFNCRLSDKEADGSEHFPALLTNTILRVVFNHYLPRTSGDVRLLKAG